MKICSGQLLLNISYVIFEVSSNCIITTTPDAKHLVLGQASQVKGTILPRLLSLQTSTT